MMETRVQEMSQRFKYNNHCHSDQKCLVIHSWTSWPETPLVYWYFFHVRFGAFRVKREGEGENQEADRAGRASGMEVSEERSEYW